MTSEAACGTSTVSPSPMPRRKFALLGLAAAALAGVAALRRRPDRPERVELYFEDGSFTALDERSSEAAHLLRLGREVLAAAGGPLA
jgi:MYXO-CTERM domain-containing protein